MTATAKTHMYRMGIGLSLVVLLLMMLSFSFASSVSAQSAQPTATPRDPSWLAFSAVRDAIEEERGVNLRTIRKWEFVQTSWEAPNPERDDRATGIDNCVEAVSAADARRIFFGWTIYITDLRGNVYEGRASFDLSAIVVCDKVTTVVAPAAPSNNATAGNLPAPVAGSGVTGGFELGGHVDGLTSDAINRMKAMGMTWVKKQLPVSAGLAKGKEFIDSAKANGMKILLGVVGDKDALATNFDSYVASYSAFVGELAAMGADAIEVWNEPNLDREWPNGQINGANYVKLLAPAYNAIKSKNPSTIVISGAPAPTGFAGAAGCIPALCNDDVFMKQMADAGAAQYMDCIGLHYNEGIVSPGTTSGDPRGEYPTYYFGSMLNRGYALFGGKPVCWTELGYLSGEGMGAPIPASFAWASNTTVAQHAAWLADAISRSASSGRVRLLIVWNINFTRWDSDPMGGYAIIRPDGTCPACAAIAPVMGK